MQTSSTSVLKMAFTIISLLLTVGGKTQSVLTEFPESVNSDG